MYVRDLYLNNKDFTRYTDINKIPNIEIEKEYSNGEAYILILIIVINILQQRMWKLGI